MPTILFSVTVAMTAQAFLRDQLRSFVDSGWDVHLVCASKDGTSSYEELQSLPGVHLHPIEMERSPHPIRDLRSFLELWQLIGKLKPDILVASTPKAGLLATVASRLRKVPSRIYHLRGLRSEGLHGVLKSVSLLGEGVAISAATSVLVDSQSLLQAMRESGLLSPTKGEVLGAGSACGVDIHHFRPPTNQERQAARNAIGFMSDELVVGFLGRLSKDKGVRELVMAAEQAHAVNPRIRLALVGPIEDDKGLSDVLDRVDSESWTHALGPTSDPRSKYWAFDLFCLPSYREGLPIAPLEAQACGLPVITTTAIGCVDSIELNVTGLAVPIRDTRVLTDTILKLAEDSDLRMRMSTAGRQRTISQFDQSTVTQNMYTYVSDAIQGQ